jgi:hypothetical protein
MNNDGVKINKFPGNKKIFPGKIIYQEVTSILLEESPVQVVSTLCSFKIWHISSPLPFQAKLKGLPSLLLLLS